MEVEAEAASASADAAQLPGLRSNALWALLHAPEPEPAPAPATRHHAAVLPAVPSASTDGSKGHSSGSCDPHAPALARHSVVAAAAVNGRGGVCHSQEFTSLPVPARAASVGRVSGCGAELCLAHAMKAQGLAPVTCMAIRP